MTTVIGLGNAGCSIANLLSEYPQYSCYKFDAGLPKDKRTFPLKEYKKIEDYEEKMPSVRSFLRGTEEDVIFIMAGGGKVSSCALKILEAVKKKKITVVYIQPEFSLLSKTQLQLEKMAYNVLQQYARSGLFKELIIVSNSSIEQLMGGLSVKNYYKEINHAIASTLHMLNVYRNNKPLFSTFDKKPEGVRISTIGAVDPESDEEKMFFSLDNVTDIEYHYAYDISEIETNNNLLSDLKTKTNNKKELVKRVTYGVYETDYKENYIYCVQSTSTIQN
tara:strand:+ start:6830 stop:7660 length:831 start_codon:yes stop_codon:yes gene_type:complete